MNTIMRAKLTAREKEEKSSQRKAHIMNTVTDAITAQKLVILREEIIPRLQENIASLNRINEASYKVGTPDAERVTAKAAALQKVIDEQGERLVNVKTENDVYTLAAMIRMTGEFDGALTEGTELAVSRIVGYLR